MLCEVYHFHHFLKQSLVNRNWYFNSNSRNNNVWNSCFDSMWILIKNQNRVEVYARYIFISESWILGRELGPSGFPLTNALSENLLSRYLNMFNLRLCNAGIIRYSLLKFGHLHLCGKGYKCFSPHCVRCYSFGRIAAIICGNACHGPHSDSVYSGSEHRQFNSPRLVKR